MTSSLPSRAVSGAPRRFVLGVVVSILATTAVIVPPVVYQYRHFHLGWYDVGVVRRAIYYFYEHGRLGPEFTPADGWRGRFMLEGAVRHVIPFYALLALPIKWFDTPGYETMITASLALSAGYVFAIGRTVCESTTAGVLCAVAYALNPYTYAIALSHHYEAFGMLFLFAFAFHGYRDHRMRAWVALILALTVKEDMWVYASAIALVLFRRDRLAQVAGYVAVASAYYGFVVYPGAHSLLRDAHTPVSGTEWSVALTVLRHWRSMPRLLFAGSGGAFQRSFAYLWPLAGWRCLPLYAILEGIS